MCLATWQGTARGVTFPGPTCKFCHSISGTAADCRESALQEGQFFLDFEYFAHNMNGSQAGPPHNLTSWAW